MKKMLVVFCLTCVFAIVASAELFVDASRTAGKGNWEGGLNAGLSTTEYEFSGRGGPIADGFEKEADRTVLSGYGAVGLTDWLDLFASGGYIINSDGIWHTDASGFVIAGGARAELWKRDNFSLMGYAQASYLSEEYEEEDWYHYVRSGSFGGGTFTSDTYSQNPPNDGGPYEIVGLDASATLTELALGFLWRYELDKLALYGGIELVPVSDGEMKSDLLDSKSDFERTGMFGIRGGATYRVRDDMFLRGEVTLVGEQTFNLGLSKVF